ncbi:MAG TPA: DUF4136 domain-containing protein [Rubrivivax sp.]
MPSRSIPSCLSPAATSQHLKTATQRELEARGMRLGHRNGMYSAWPPYPNQTIVTPYKGGTLNVDVVDSALKQLVWEGVVTGTVTQNSLDNVQPALDAAVSAAFAKYPVKPSGAK